MTFDTISKMFLATTDKFPNKNLYYYKNNNSWESMTGSDIKKKVKNLSFALSSMDVGPGKNIAIMSTNSPDWAMCDYSIICTGAATVTIYPTLIPKQIKYILNNSNAQLIFVENEEQCNKICQVWDECPDLKYVVIMDDSQCTMKDNCYKLSDFENMGVEYQNSSSTDFESLCNQAKPDDLLTLIYTSGTTGEPKGVMLTHGNIISNIEGVYENVTMNDDDALLSFLPMSHVFERTLGHFASFSKGATTYYAESIEKVPDNLVETSPTIVLSVPRLYEKIYSKIKIGLETASPIKKKLFAFA